MNTKTTIENARKYMSDHFEEGTKCPCCGQFVKKYKRKLNSGMAKTLGRIYAYYPNSFIDVKDLLRQKKFHNGHDWTLLRHWGFLTTNEEGLWKITDTGKAWIDFKTPTHSHIYMYNNKMMGFAEGTITFRQAYGNDFDIKELMK